MAENQILQKAGLTSTPNPSLQDVVSIAVAEDTIKATELASQLSDAQNKSKAIQGELVEGIKATASNDVIAQVTKDSAELQRQNQSNAILAAAGGTDAQVSLMTALNNQGNKVDSLLAEKESVMNEDITGITLLDQVINSFRTIDTDVALRGAINRENHTVRRINNVGAAQESFNRTNTINKQNINNATIAANSRKIEQLATIDAQKQELTNIHNNSAALLTISQADAGVTKSLLKAYELQGSIESREIQRTRIEFQKEEMQQQRDQWETRKPLLKTQLETAQLNLSTAKFVNDAEKTAKVAQFTQLQKEIADGLALEEQQVESVQRTQSAAGLPVETPEVITARFANSATRERYIDLQTMGSNEAPVYGTSPAEAFKNFRTVIDPDGRLPLNAKTSLLKEAADMQQAAYAASDDKPPTDEKALMADYDKATAVVMKGYKDNIKAGDQTNPYQAPPMEVLADSKSVQESALYQKVLADQPITEVTPQVIMDHAINGMLAGLISPEEAAAGIDTLFTAAAVHNNANMGGFSRVGLSEYNQTTYNTQLIRPNTAYESLKVGLGKALLPSNPFSSDRSTLFKEVAGQSSLTTSLDTVDLMNVTQVKAALVRGLNSVKAEPAVANPAISEPEPKQRVKPIDMFSVSGGAQSTQ